MLWKALCKSMYVINKIKITSKIILKHKQYFAFPISLLDCSLGDTSLLFFFGLLLWGRFNFFIYFFF